MTRIEIVIIRQQRKRFAGTRRCYQPILCVTLDRASSGTLGTLLLATCDFEQDVCEGLGAELRHKQDKTGFNKRNHL